MTKGLADSNSTLTGLRITDRVYISEFTCERLTIASKHQKGVLIGLILCNACLRGFNLHKMDWQALTFSCISHTCMSYTHIFPLRRFQGVCSALQFELICMQVFGRPDERVVHVCLMDSLIGSALTSEAGERRMA